MQICENKKLSLVPYLAVAVILLVALPLAMSSNCDQLMCFFTPTDNWGDSRNATDINWILTYVVLVVGIMIVAKAVNEIMDSDDAGFAFGFTALMCLICIGVPLMHGNVGDCDAPLCYLDGPKNDKDVYANNAANYQAFYVATTIQIVLGSLALMMALPIKENGEELLKVFLTGMLVALLCVIAPMLNGNIGECDVPLCYFGAPDVPNESKYDSQRELHENLNTIAFLLVLIVQILVGYFFVRSVCDAKTILYINVKKTR